MKESEGNNYRLNVSALRQMPRAIRQVYLLSADGLPKTNPESMRLVFDIPAKIVYVIDINWGCAESNDLVTFDHNTINGVVNLTVTLPSCANFQLNFRPMLTNGRLYRGDTMSYELPEAHSTSHTQWSGFNLGRTVTVHVRPNGAARFVIDTPNGFAWFDTL
jgi:hypothetical protein